MASHVFSLFSSFCIHFFNSSFTWAFSTYTFPFSSFTQFTPATSCLHFAIWFATLWTFFFPVVLCDSLTSSCLFRLDALALSVIATATWLAGWLSHSGIVSKPLSLLENFFDHLKAPSFYFSETPASIKNSTGNPFVKYTGVGKLAIFDVHCCLSRKRCEIGRWLLWNVNRKSWVPDWMV